MSNDDLFQLWVDKGQGMKALKSVYQQGRADAEKDDLIKACINQLKESDADEIKVSADTKDGYKVTVIVELKEQTE